jgi:hypothetical protein
MSKDKKRELKSLDPKQLAMVTGGDAVGPSAWDCSGAKKQLGLKARIGRA